MIRCAIAIPFDMQLRIPPPAGTHNTALPAPPVTSPPQPHVEMPLIVKGPIPKGQKMTMKTLHMNQPIAQSGHDCGMMMPHIHPVNTLLPIATMFSERPFKFQATTVQMDGQPPASGQMLMVPMMMSICGEPAATPLGFAPLTTLHTASYGMSVAAYVGQCMQLAGEMVVEHYVDKLWNWAGDSVASKLKQAASPAWNSIVKKATTIPVGGAVARFTKKAMDKIADKVGDKVGKEAAGEFADKTKEVVAEEVTGYKSVNDFAKKEANEEVKSTGIYDTESKKAQAVEMEAMPVAERDNTAVANNGEPPPSFKDNVRQKQNVQRNQLRDTQNDATQSDDQKASSQGSQQSDDQKASSGNESASAAQAQAQSYFGRRLGG